MEIIEIVSYHLNFLGNSIEVKFKLNDDDENELRTDEIDLSEASDFDYEILSYDSAFFDDDEDEGRLYDDDVNEDELLLFLNEYYIVFPERLPEKDYY